MFVASQSNLTAAQLPAAPVNSGSRAGQLALRLLTSNPALIAVLVALNLICFHRTVVGYFLADDYVHVAYLWQVFHGHPELLLQNFFSNWLQAEGTQFYRPFISLTLAFDYLIWGANSVGYHLTNTLFQIASSIFLFLLARRLLNGFGKGQSTVVGFFSGALFAVFPLHCEVVSWVIGRVDSVSTAFLLASFWLFLVASQDRSGRARLLSLVAFVLSLLSKEMAVTLPPTLCLCCLICLRPQGSWRERLSYMARETGPFWAAAIAYLGIRTAALGTICGGYSGSIGEGLSGSLVKRWFQDGSLLRVLYPFNAEVFLPGDSLRRTLRSLYLISTLSLVCRLIFLRTRCGLNRYALFALGWLILSLIPTYQVWNLTETLQGSRFIYLGTAPLCLLINLLVFPLGQALASQGPIRILQQASIALLGALVLCFAGITLRNNQPWAHASNQVRDLRAAIEKRLEKLPPKKKLVLLNLPQRIQGAHMLYNASMLSVLLRPPLSSKILSDRLVTFEPITYGDSDLLIVSRLKRLVADPHGYEFCTWDMVHQRLIPLSLVPYDQELTFGPQELAVDFWNGQGQDQGKPELIASSTGLNCADLTADQYLVSPPLNLSSLATDFVEVELACTSAGVVKRSDASPPQVALIWTGHPILIFPPTNRLSLPVIADGQPHLYRFPVSQRKSWVLCSSIRAIGLDLPSGAYRNTLKRVELVSGASQIPVLSADQSHLPEDLAGVCRMSDSTCALEFDASSLAGASKVLVELSKPDSWFEHYGGGYHDRSLSEHSLRHWELASVQGRFEIPVSYFPAAGYYQVRIAGLSADGHMVGCTSDPINLQVASEQISGSSRRAAARNRSPRPKNAD